MSMAQGAPMLQLVLGGGQKAKNTGALELTMTILYSLPLHHHPSSVEKTPPMTCGLWSGVRSATPHVRATPNKVP